MEIDAFLADSADSVQGKIYALGIGWNTIFANQFPTIHPRVAVGITIHVPYTATNQRHTVSLKLQTEDGQDVALGTDASSGEPIPVMELGGEFNVGRPPLLPAGDEQIVAIALTINGLLFEAPNSFSWVISIDGSVEKKLPMRVQQLT